jgi:hypothetical protein
MKKLVLKEKLVPYPLTLLEKWKAKNYYMLKSSGTSKYIKDIS